MIVDDIGVTATAGGLVLDADGAVVQAPPSLTIDELFRSSDPVGLARDTFVAGEPVVDAPAAMLAPIGAQEVWAAGVTYERSREARVEESSDAGGGSFYDRVYDADRPELFLKATPHRVAGPGAAVRIRSDSGWNVPEPELTLAVSAAGTIFGYTVGNDMSSRDIEGENPLYLPQAKTYAGSAALGPRLVVSGELPAPNTTISMEIERGGQIVFTGSTGIARIRRPLPSLVEWLFRDNEFPHGCYLMTGTGIVPEDDFTLEIGDEVRITIDAVGTLVNHVAR
jgi:2-dehydro-3-deoxy-D-arabinonate dehydratase